MMNEFIACSSMSAKTCESLAMTQIRSFVEMEPRISFSEHMSMNESGLSFPSEAQSRVLIILSLQKARSQDTCEKNRVSKY